MRSLLFVPADDTRKVRRALEAGADAVILDLEDSVAPSRKEEARSLAAVTLAAPDRRRLPKLFVRVNALSTGITRADIDAVMPQRPDGLVLPKAEGPRDVHALAALAGAAPPVVAIATETARALFHMAHYADAAPHLCALAWGVEDLSADLGASATRDEAGLLTDPGRLARVLCLAAAKAAKVEAIDGVYVDTRDEAGLLAECRSAARDGFTGKLAIHPAQVAVINRSFTPSETAVAEARRVAAAFEADKDAGVIAIEGRMYDRPHLERARKLLARAAAYAGINPGDAS